MGECRCHESGGKGQLAELGVEMLGLHGCLGISVQSFEMALRLGRI